MTDEPIKPIIIRVPAELVDRIKIVGETPYDIGYTYVPNTTAATGTTYNYTWQTTPAPALFGTWLAKTKELQESFFGQKFEDFDQKRLEEWIRVNVLAAEDELHESLGEVSWKPWASAAFFNREAFLDEIVDSMHFIGNLLCGAQVTDEELTERYLAKMERNRARQTEGYTGLDKCSQCKRAVDDIKAHDGYIVSGYYDTRGDLHQWCNSCSKLEGDPEEPFNTEVSCEVCEKFPKDLPGYVFRFYDRTKSETVHRSGYGCSKCHCDPADDYK